ncbi:MAG: AAA family ATPase [Candidatus Spechtbacteria bacterium]|nr:AAA family ATPase [Candidatus Spechtbacteria bacterium]
MYIKALELKNFKKFKDTRVEFLGDITTIKGKNEQGKSTLVEALLAALFFDPTLPTVPKYVKDYQSWHSEKLYRLILYFEAAGEDFALGKDFEEQKIILKKDSGDVVSHDFDEISKKLSEMGGYTNKDLFSNLGIIKKDSLVLLNAGKKKIMDALQELVTGSGASVSVGEIIKRIQDAESQLIKGIDSNRPIKNVGKIKLLQDSLSETQEGMTEIKQSADKRQEMLGDLEDIKKKLSTLLEQVDIGEHEYATNEKYFKSKIRMEEVKRELDRVLDDLEAYERLDNKKKEFVELLSKLEAPKQTEIEKAENLQRNLDSAQDRVDDLGRLSRSLKDKHRKKYYPSRNIFLGISALLFVAGIGGLWIKLLFISWVFLVAFAAFYFASGRYKESLKLAELEKEEEDKKKAVAEFSAELKTILKKFNVAALHELRDIPSKIKETKQHIESLENEQEAVLRKKTLSEAEAYKRELQNHLAIEEQKLTDEQRVSPPEPSRQRELEKKIERLKKESERMKEEKIATKAKIESIKLTAEDVLEQEEKILNLQGQIGMLTRKARKYEVLASALQEARDKSLIKTREALERMMGEYIDEITEGKYTSIRLDNEFDIKVYSPEKGDYVGVEYLSTGAVDQLYIVARFALIAILYSKSSVDNFTRRPIVILDDPFGNFDEERREKTRGILERLSKDFQILLFTCVSNYDDWGKLVEM